MVPEKEEEGAGSGVEVETEGEDGSQAGSERTSEDPTSGTDGQGSSEAPGAGGSPNPQQLQFRHQLLKGKSPEEIERLFETMTEANRSMNRQLNERVSQPSAPAPGQQQRVQEEEEEEANPYGDTFIAPQMAKLEQRLKKHLEKTAAPLRENMERNQGDVTRERLRKELRHFEMLETSIDTLIREQGGNPLATGESQLRLLYHTAVGLAAERGIDLGKGKTEAPAPNGGSQTPATKEEEPPVTNIPQHRPSGAPLPSKPTAKRRQLDENEKRLAREFFPDSQDPEGEYLKEMARDEADVVEPGFSKKGW